MSTSQTDTQRQISFVQALNEAHRQILAADTSSFVMGIGVPDPGGIYGSTKGLADDFPDRVFDGPASENALTGIVLGAAMSGARPILVHARLDFALLTVEMLVNQAAKTRYMYSGRHSAPLTVRMVIGRGWGQGPQHSQSLHSWFAHIPGLKVVMPTTAYDAKGLLHAAHNDPDPVIFIEHRWLYQGTSVVPEEPYTVDIGSANVLKSGKDISIIAPSLMAIESLRAARLLEQHGISAEVIDLRTIQPLDFATIFSSVQKTGRALVVDNSWIDFGISAEIVAKLCETCFNDLQASPVRMGYAPAPCPTSFGLTPTYYPTPITIAEKAAHILGVRLPETFAADNTSDLPHDIPHADFTGPF